MNKLYKTILITAGLSLYVHPVFSLGLINTCMTKSECEQKLTLGKMCCCKGKDVTNYVCPSGWGLMGTMCYRANSDAGNDSIGYKETVYGSCSAEANGTTWQECYEITQVNTCLSNCLRS